MYHTLSMDVFNSLKHLIEYIHDFPFIFNRSCKTNRRGKMFVCFAYKCMCEWVSEWVSVCMCVCVRACMRVCVFFTNKFLTDTRLLFTTSYTEYHEHIWGCFISVWNAWCKVCSHCKWLSSTATFQCTFHLLQHIFRVFLPIAEMPIWTQSWAYVKDTGKWLIWEMTLSWIFT